MVLHHLLAQRARRESDPGVVDQDVQAAECGDRRRHRGGPLFLLRHIEGEGECGRTNSCGHPGGVRDVAQRDTSPVVGEQPGLGRALAHGGAGDERHLAFEPFLHQAITSFIESRA